LQKKGKVNRKRSRKTDGGYNSVNFGSSILFAPSDLGHILVYLGHFSS
jgi:hypothetical protein